jgi:hypothetical protein
MAEPAPARQPEVFLQYELKDFKLAVYTYPRNLRTAYLLRRASFKKCGGWLRSELEQSGGVVLVCTLDSGEVETCGGTVASSSVLLGYIFFYPTAAREIYVSLLCSFIDGFCVGTVLLHAAAQYTQELGLSTLRLDALPSAATFYKRFFPKDGPVNPRSKMPNFYWDDMAELKDRLLASLRTCTPKYIPIVYQIYLVWLQYIKTSAARTSECFLFDHDKNYVFICETFMDAIENCPSFQEYLKKCMPNYKVRLHDLMIERSKAPRAGTADAADEAERLRRDPWAPAVRAQPDPEDRNRDRDYRRGRGRSRSRSRSRPAPSPERFPGRGEKPPWNRAFLGPSGAGSAESTESVVRGERPPSSAGSAESPEPVVRGVKPPWNPAFLEPKTSKSFVSAGGRGSRKRGSRKLGSRKRGSRKQGSRKQGSRKRDSRRSRAR